MINKDYEIMIKAVELSKKCPYSRGAFSVGAIIVDEKLNIISTGFSRETSDHVHAEEVAINKAIRNGVNLEGTTIYTTMEPCGLRLSGNLCCAQRIIDSGIKNVVYGINEPHTFVKNTTGIEKLNHAGITVNQFIEIKKHVDEVNKYVIEG